jgi:hypothetical protein
MQHEGHLLLLVVRVVRCRGDEAHEARVQERVHIEMIGMLKGIGLVAIEYLWSVANCEPEARYY